MNKYSDRLPYQLARQRAKYPSFESSGCVTAGEYLNLEPISRCLVIKDQALCEGAMSKMNKREIATLATDPTDC